MSVKFVFLFFACCALVMAQRPNTVRISDDSSVTSTSSTSSDSNSDSAGIDNMERELNRLANRVRNAVNQTYGEERDSISDSWDSVKDLMIQRIQTGANLMKTAVDLGTMGPKIARNLVLPSDNDE